MADPPKPPPPNKKEQPEDLAEVERALSLLAGRHPEHERLRREDEEKKRKRAADQDAVAKKEGRRIQSRRALVGLGIAVALFVIVVGVLAFRGEVSRRAHLEQAADPYRAMGFVLVETSSRGDPKIEAASVSAGCVLATSTQAGAKLKVTYTGGSLEGLAPVLTCLCEGMKVSVSGEGLAPGEGVVLLRAESSAIGGSRAFGFLPFKPGTAGKTDQACGEASLDAWLDTSPAKVVSPADAAWLDGDPKRAVLRSLEMKPAMLLKADMPFVAGEVPASSCLLISGTAGVRLRGGAFAVEGNNAAWCTSTETKIVVQHEDGAGEAIVLVGPASRVGGLAGLSEVALAAGITVGASRIASTDHGWSAKQLLIASAIPETLVSTTNTPDVDASTKDVEARIVALSVELPSALGVETPPDVYSFCEPALGRVRSAVCVFSGTQKWRPSNAESVGGLARAKLPFWLFALQTVNEPAALKIETSLITLARQLRRDGFEPTTIEAVIELDKGAEVLGRANEDAMVVFGLAAVDPWVFPYSDSLASPWVIGETPPRIVPIKPLERVTLTSVVKNLPPVKSSRRTVVFRRQKR